MWLPPLDQNPDPNAGEKANRGFISKITTRTDTQENTKDKTEMQTEMKLGTKHETENLRQKTGDNRQETGFQGLSKKQTQDIQ